MNGRNEKGYFCSIVRGKSDKFHKTTMTKKTEFGTGAHEATKLRSGNAMPLLGFGTYKIEDTPAGGEVIPQAYNCGYRMFDCAAFYQNEATVGKALSSYDRSSLYIISKVWTDTIYAGPEAVKARCLQTIRDL